MKRAAIHTLDFTLVCESGLHIGGSQDELVIGGSDNPVIKNPATRKPYVPGSSLKGKMRAELEKQAGRFGGKQRSEPCTCAKCHVCRVFGAHKNTKGELGPSRIIVRDGRLKGSCQIENKTENVIDRKTGAAKHPRSNERVAEGATFSIRIVLQVFELDGRFRYSGEAGESYTGGDALQAVVADGLRLVQMTGLGGGTSRGSGAVKMTGFTLDGQPWKHWFE